MVFIAVCLLWIGLGVRSAYLQVLPNERLDQLKQRQFQRTLTLRPQRGRIFDRNDKELAVSISAYSLFADPKLIKNPKTLARRLSKKLGIKWGKIYKKIKHPKKRFVWIERRLSKKVTDKIRSWNHRGLGFVKEPRRIYPNGDLLSQVIGMVGSNGRGLEGLELQFDDLLSGQEIQVNVQRDARGRPLISESQLLEQKVHATDVMLTIDSELQYVFEKELSYAVEFLEADSGVGVVLDARTSEILAMVSMPTYDANNALSVDPQKRKNRALTDFFEPGSTMKTILIAASLREEIVQPNSRYFCENGRLKVGRRWIRESDSHHTWGELSVSEILAVSSNVCSAKIAFDLGDERLYKSLMDFGFAKKTGVMFPGEAVGLLGKPPWRKHLLGNISFGHGIAATPIQMAQAYATIASGGILRRPLLVKGLKNSVTGELTRFTAEPIRRVLSEKQSQTMRLMLMGVTSQGGTGYNARVQGFPVAGKTGTAQKVKTNGRGYQKGAYISSFAGFIPAGDPRFVIYVALDNPKKQYYGSQVAAPVFSRVASYAVRRAGLSPILIDRKNLLPQKPPKVLKPKKRLKLVKGELLKGKVPNLKQLTVREVLDATRESDIKFKFKGEGVVFQTLPTSGRLIPKSKTINIYLKESE